MQFITSTRRGGFVGGLLYPRRNLFRVLVVLSMLLSKLLNYLHTVKLSTFYCAYFLCEAPVRTGCRRAVYRSVRYRGRAGGIPASGIPFGAISGLGKGCTGNQAVYRYPTGIPVTVALLHHASPRKGEVSRTLASDGKKGYASSVSHALIGIQDQQTASIPTCKSRRHCSR